MPIYEYLCDTCGIFTSLRKMDESAALGVCLQCGADAKRVLSAPHLSAVSSDLRKVYKRNEASAERPRLASQEHVCAGAGCKAHGSSRRTSPGSRPWMLSH
ncbi:FmdB family zinc ribbon protein [Acidithiobacillus sp.]